jgi:hypothetical protein
MISRVEVFALLILIAPCACAQIPSASVTYVLHPERPLPANHMTLTLKAAASEAVLGMTPDGSKVLALIPQEKNLWSLEMLTGWQTGSPQEQTLSFLGDDPPDKLDYMTGGLTPTPDGKYLLIRILVYHFAKLTREVVVVLVDLQEFHVVWRHASADPLLANSQWRFSEEGVLIAAEGPPPSEGGKRYALLPDVRSMDPTLIGEHDAAELSFPDLDPTLPCHYMVVSGPFYTEASSTSALLKSDTCQAFLKAAGVAEATELPGPSDVARLKRLGGPDCELVTSSEGSKLALYTCRTGRDLGKYGFDTKTRAVKVLSVENGNTILSMPLPVKQATSSTLATLEGHDYLLLLRNGIEFEAYSLR